MSPQGMSAEQRVLELVKSGETDWHNHVIPTKKQEAIHDRYTAREVLGKG